MPCSFRPSRKPRPTASSVKSYEGDQKSLGFVPNHAKVFTLRPDVLEAWRAFQGSIRKNLRLRRYELVTLAAADALDCRYCLLAHGAILNEERRQRGPAARDPQRLP